MADDVPDTLMRDQEIGAPALGSASDTDDEATALSALRAALATLRRKNRLMADVVRSSGAAAAVTMTDLSELEQVESDLEAATSRMETALARREATMALLHRVAVVVNRAATVEEAIGGILPEVARHLGAVFAQVWLGIDDDPGSLAVRGAGFTLEPKRTASLAAASEGRHPVSDCPLVRSAVETGETRWSDDPESAVGAARSAAVAAAGPSHAVAMPVLSCDRPVGAVELLVDDLDLPVEHLKMLAAGVGGDLGNVIERVGLQRKLSDLSEQEQHRLGRELHDTVAQEIAGVRLLAEAVRRRLDPGSPECATVDELVEAARLAQDHVRSLARGLVPVVIAAGGLRSAVEGLVERVQAEHGLRCEFRNPSGVVVSNSELATNLFYIIQEAVNNAVRHGDPDSVTVELEESSGELRTRIVDDGDGFSVGESAAGPGSGLRIMRYRARLIGGRLDIASEPGAGTTVTCKVRS